MVDVSAKIQTRVCRSQEPDLPGIRGRLSPEQGPLPTPRAGGGGGLHTGTHTHPLNDIHTVGVVLSFLPHHYRHVLMSAHSPFIGFLIHT